MNEFFERVMEAQREALKNQIAANTILINEKLAEVKPFIFGNSLIPALICGLEVKVTNELPDNVSFAVAKATQTEREKLIAKIRTQTAKEFLEELDNRFWDDIDTNADIGGAEHNQTIRSLMKWIKRTYGVEVEE